LPDLQWGSDRHRGRTPCLFPADYHGKDVAGKTADFLVTVKKIEAALAVK